MMGYESESKKNEARREKSEHMYTIGLAGNECTTGGRAVVVVSPDHSPLRKWYEYMLFVFTPSTVNSPLCGPNPFDC